MKPDFENLNFLKHLMTDSVARCAIFPQNLAIFWFGWRVADFLAILAVFRRKIGGFLCKI